MLVFINYQLMSSIICVMPHMRMYLFVLTLCVMCRNTHRERSQFKPNLINITPSTEVLFDTLTCETQDHLLKTNKQTKNLFTGFLKWQWLLPRQENQSELNLLISFHDYCSQMENLIKTNAIFVHFP